MAKVRKILSIASSGSSVPEMMTEKIRFREGDGKGEKDIEYS